MEKHVILWQLKDELTDAQKQEVKEAAKQQLEGLLGKVPGLLQIQIFAVCHPEGFTMPMLSRSSVGIISRPIQAIAAPHRPSGSKGE